MSTIGAFTHGVARLSSYEDIELSRTGRISAITAVYVFVLASPSTIPTTTNVSGLPKEGDAFSSTDLWLVAEAPKLSRADRTSGVWEARVEYKRGGIDTGSSGGSAAERGNIEALRYSWGSNSVDLVESKSAGIQTSGGYGHVKPAGSPLINAAGDPYDGTVQVDNADLVITFVRRERALYTAALACNGTVNSSDTTVLGISIGKHCGRATVDVEDTLTDNKYRYRYTYTITIRKNVVDETDIGWDIGVLEAGWRYLDADTNEPTAFTVTDENGRKVAPSAPQLLDSYGRPVGTSVKAISVYGPYPESNWAALNLPAGIPSVQIEEDDEDD